MRQTPTTTILSTFLAACAMTIVFPAFAGKLDLNLSNFANCNPDSAPPGMCDPQYADYETFMAEYAFGIAPKRMAPAETLGYSGFYVGFEESISIRPTGSAADTRWNTATPSDEVQAIMFNPGIHIRKGLPFSFEFGSTVNFLALSKLVTVGGELKWSLFEGYRTGWRAFLPDISVRGSIVRIMGAEDVDMSIVGLDGSISYAFGVGGMITLTPYAGYQFTWTIINLEPMMYRDSNGYHAESTDTEGNTTWAASGLGNPILMRSNAFFGLRIGYEIIAFTTEVGWGMPGSWKTDQKRAEDTEYPTAKVGHQIQINCGIGVDF
jgi:hypothetical protein